MKVRKTFLLLLIILTTGVLLPALVSASPSEQFYQRGGHIYDDWGIFRTRGFGADGFMAVSSTDFNPIIARESLGENVDLAWQLGEEFTRKYPDRNQRAERIFYFVRDRVRYVSDADQFGRAEFAQNADEVAATIVEMGMARGDCEDSAILLAVMYKAAGYRSAMVLMPGHVATLVFLPGYRKAPRKMTLAGEKGWVWAEATGATNPFGWVPGALITGEMRAREVTTGELDTQESGPVAVTLEEGSPRKGSGAISVTGLITLVGTVGLLWAMAGGRGSARRFRRRQ